LRPKPVVSPYSVEDFHLLHHAGFDRRFHNVFGSTFPLSEIRLGDVNLAVGKERKSTKRCNIYNKVPRSTYYSSEKDSDKSQRLGVEMCIKGRAISDPAF
jgi:hypothetical protein